MNTKLEKTIIVNIDNTASAVGSGDCLVFATPIMIAEMENISATLANNLIKEKQTTVGTKLNINHISATPIGAEVTICSEITFSNEKFFEFSVSAFDKAGMIGSGTHVRVIVDRDKFVEKANLKLR